MKEIKAYIRVSKVEAVINGLYAIGIENLTVIDIMALGKGLVDPKHYQYSIEIVQKYSEVAKVELIAPDNDVKQVVEVIQSIAYSGQKGDGIIFISPVAEAIKIRTGKTGEEIL